MSIKFKSKEYTDNYERVLKMNELYKGNQTVKEQGAKYLLKKKNETTEHFAERLKMSSFYNYLKEAIDDSTSKLFRKKPVIDYKIKFDNFFDNVSSDGENIEQFMMNIADKVQIDGHTFVWVDAGNDVSDKNWKPYFTQIDRLDVTNIKYSKINGIKTMVKAVIKQKILIDIDEYESKEVDIYIDITKERIKILDSEDNVLSTEELSIGYFPLIKISSGGDLPYEDLGSLNIDHYNIYSGLINNLNISNSPIYVFHGIEQDLGLQSNETDNKLQFGSDKAFSCGNKQEQGISIVESEGKTIETTRNVLKDIKEEIVKKTSSIMNKSFNTATEANLHDKNSNLLLVDIAINIEKGIQECVKVAEMFYSEDFGFKIKLNKDFNDSRLDSQTIFALNTMIDSNSLPLDVFWDTIIEGEIVHEFDYTKAKETLSLQKELLNTGTGVKDKKIEKE